jgi:hypothetical protein
MQYEDETMEEQKMNVVVSTKQVTKPIDRTSVV